jgi:hypothetical protein
LCKLSHKQDRAVQQQGCPLARLLAASVALAAAALARTFCECWQAAGATAAGTGVTTALIAQNQMNATAALLNVKILAHMLRRRMVPHIMLMLAWATMAVVAMKQHPLQ